MDYECLKILSLNVRGMKDAKKRREIFRWLKRYHGAESSVIFLQETHSEMETEKYWDKDWGSKIYFSHGTNYARGVAIMMPMKFNFEIGNFWADKDGRIVTICLKYNDEYLTLVNIYAPTKDKKDDQVSFLTNLVQNIDLLENPTIIGGDFNTYLNPILDKDGGKPESQTLFASSIIQYCEDNNFSDIWRVMHPELRRYTWRQSTPRIQSRLDHFLDSNELFYNVEKCDIKTSIKTDHSLILLTIALKGEQKRGPGFWKFNTSLLKDEIYIGMIHGFIEKFKNDYSEIQNHALKWDLIKSGLRQCTIDYCKTQAKIRRQQEDELYQLLNKTADLLEKHSTQENLNVYNNVKMQLEELNKIKTAGIFLCSKAQFVDDHERSSKAFIQMEKRNYKMKHIQKLKISEHEDITDPEKILAEEENFYKSLYTAKLTNNLDDLNDQFLEHNIPKLDLADKNLCEQEVTKQECASALKELKNGKSPGSDGFPPEFYKMFWKSISELVFDSICYAYKNGELSIEQKRGVLKLIPKKEKDPCYLKNWRPITLLNTDYKIVAQIMAMRLQKVLHKIIGEGQNGYIQTRYVGYNIRTITF